MPTVPILNIMLHVIYSFSGLYMKKSVTDWSHHPPLEPVGFDIQQRQEVDRLQSFLRRAVFGM